MSTPTEVIGRYRVERRLGAGGMSTVFLAMDTVLEREVAVKLLAEHLAEDEAFVMRFRREALAAARLQHPNVVQVFDSGHDEEAGRHFIVMEYVKGPSCADMLRDHDALEIADAVRIARDACHGLDYAHRAGVVHRDVKPGNLLVSSDSGSTKLADFGIAKATEQSRITQVGSVLGTAAYLSPEQARGEESGPPSDIYSLGVCIYQFLAGRLPHEYSSLTELALKQQSDPVDPIRNARPEVPDALDRAVLACLRRDPEARYASALELSEALEAGLRGEVSETTLRLEAMPADVTQPTQAMSAQAQPTRVLQARPEAPAPARPRTRGPKQPPPARRRRPRPNLPLILSVLVVLVLVGLLIALAGGDEGVPPVNEDNVADQVRELKRLLQDNSR